MGLVRAVMQVANPAQPARREELELLVDTGATYSLIPAAFLARLGITPAETLEFETADGRTIRRSVGEALFFWDGRSRTCPVIFGEDTDSALLGVIALEALVLEVDPVNQQLRRARLLLY
jgi:clan AA aspartic protease